jgi:histidyl-tRNA synthetase
MSVRPVRGTVDLFPDDIRRHRRVIETARDLAELYGFGEIQTPIFEFTEVFARTLGDVSDVVTKEMYTFEDRGGEKITLRPENTAGVARAYISGKLQNELPLKYFYAGPMFRYERPQKGRQRQFHQIGVELFGVPFPSGDVEVIALAAQLLDKLGMRDHCVLNLNTLGDTESRETYRAALVEYFSSHKARLSSDSLARLDKNPLRILDSKDESDKKVVEGAPSFNEFLTTMASDFFAEVLQGLDELDISYVLNPRLVRGLDYYCHTAFEFVTDALGAQGTVIGGGRYDGLIGIMGGASTPGVGWAGGIERLAMLADQTLPEITTSKPISLIPIGVAAEQKLKQLAYDLRGNGQHVDISFSGNLKRRMQRAGKLGARFALIVGEDELHANKATLRDMESGSQEEIRLQDVVKRLSDL